LFNEIRNPKSCVQLIICARKDGQKQIERFLATPIVIPSLAKRAQDMELDRIIIEYANNAMAELNVVQPIFTDEDCDWVRTFSASSLSDIEKGTRRLVAFRTSPSVAVAAGRLGMAQVSLSRWLGRRSLPKIKKRAAPGAGSRQRQRLESH
jgi:hypothetical protein